MQTDPQPHHNPVPLLLGSARMAFLQRLLALSAAAGPGSEPRSSWLVTPSADDPQEVIRLQKPGLAWKTRLRAAVLRHNRLEAAPDQGLLADLMVQLRPILSGSSPVMVDRILLSKGQCAGIFLGSEWHVKVATEAAHLQDEFQRQMRAWQRAPAHVPEPIANGVTPGGLQWLLSRQVDCNPAGAADLRLDGPRSRLLLLALQQVWCSSDDADASRSSPGVTNEHLLEFLVSEGYLSYSVCADMKQMGARNLLRDLPHQPQHGDLWCGNVGFRLARESKATQSGHAPVLFDWEDYGRLALPGLDIYLLHCSGIPVADRVWRSVMGPWIKPADLQRLEPVYEGCRRWLRRRFAPAAQRPLKAVKVLKNQAGTRP